MRTTVLNAEDNLDDVLLLKHACRKAQAGFDLHFVEHGEAALEYLLAKGEYIDRSKHPLPNLILLDLNMPRKSGLEVLEWIKQEAAFRSIPVAIFTSSTNEDDIKRAIKLGADCYVAKPLSYGSLVSFVERLDAILRENQTNLNSGLSKLPECCFIRDKAEKDRR